MKVSAGRPTPVRAGRRGHVRLLRPALGAAVLLAAGCTAPPPVPAPPPRDPVERAYLPPAAPPPAPPPALDLALAPEPAIDGLARLLAGEAPDRLRRGRDADGTAWLVLTSRGDPRPFVDCGTFVLAEPGAPERRLPAASLEVRIPVLPAERREVLLRQLRLDGRLGLLARPTPSGSRLELRADYVLTRTVDRVTRDGRVLDSQRQTVGFASGERASFDQGLVCQPTGRLEAAALEAVRTLSGEAGQGVAEGVPRADGADGGGRAAGSSPRP